MNVDRSLISRQRQIRIQRVMLPFHRIDHSLPHEFLTAALQSAPELVVPVLLHNPANVAMIPRQSPLGCQEVRRGNAA
jgi:hypothetical protein